MILEDIFALKNSSPLQFMRLTFAFFVRLPAENDVPRPPNDDNRSQTYPDLEPDEVFPDPSRSLISL